MNGSDLHIHVRSLRTWGWVWVKDIVSHLGKRPLAFLRELPPNPIFCTVAGVLIARIQDLSKVVFKTWAVFDNIGDSIARID
jgi:hypothetical protein